MNDPFIIKEDNPNIKDKKINTFYRRRYVGEDELTSGKKPGLSRVFNRQRLNILISIFLLIFVIFFGRLFFLQIIKGETFLKQAEGNRLKLKTIKAIRGVVYDVNGNLLVKNIPSVSLEITPAYLNDDEKEHIINELADYLHISFEEINNSLNKVSTPYQKVVIIDDLDYKQTLDLKVMSAFWSGVDLKIKSKRKYNFDKYTSHILGYMGKISDKNKNLIKKGLYSFDDYLGKTGLEKEYENELKGIDGKKQIEVNVLGKELNIISEKKAIPGKSLILNLDIDLQKKLYQALEKQMILAGSEKASAVILNPQNNAVLAMVSLPSFDNNMFNSKKNNNEIAIYFQDKNQPLFFRPLQGEYPSGSIFKPIVALAALEQGIITKSTSFLSTGGLRVSRWFFPDWKAGGHGKTNVIKALAESVNTFFYYIGGGYGDFQGLGVKKIVSFAKKFGFTTVSGIDFPQEADGFLPSKEWKQKVKKERWYIGDTYNVSIGQGDVLVTPIQMAVAYSAILNKGNFYSPRFVKGFKDEKTGKINLLEPELLASNLASKKNLDIVKQGLKAAVDWGSARRLSLLKVSSGGKTGTAQVGGDKKTHAWFMGFAPYDNPQLVIAVLIENGGEGSSFAVPVAYDVFKWYFDDNKKDE